MSSDKEELRRRIDAIEKLPTYKERTQARLKLIEEMQ